MASLMSALPAWTLVDPLPVLGRVKRREDNDGPALDDGDAALEHMFNKPGGQAPDGAPPAVRSARAVTPRHATETAPAPAEAPSETRSTEQPA
mgnify:FL=1